MDQRAEDCIREQEQLASARGVWEGHWREVAERVRPEQNFFQMIQRPDGDKRNEKIFDATAPLALSKFTAAVISMSFPATQTYHKLQLSDDDANNDTSVRRYLDMVNDRLFKVRYAPAANWQSQSGETVMDVGAFGTGILFVDDVLGIGIRYKSLPLAQCYIAEDAHGRVDTLHRKFQWTAHQAATRFGKDKLPPMMQKALEIEPQKKFWFLHCVKPNMDRKPGRRDYQGMAFWSCYIALDEGRAILDEGGFRCFPFAVPRFETGPNEFYGRSPAMKVLPDIKMLNEMSKTVLRAAHMAVSPPIMLSDDGALQAFNLRPNALNFGAMDEQGRARAMPFQTGARVDIGLDMMNQRREAINDAFFVTLFRILVEEPAITATEAMLRAQEKGQLLAPTMGRIQSEMLSTVIEREIDILAHSGALPPMPDALIEYYQSGGSHHIEYQSPLNQAQKAGAGVAIMNTMQAIAPLAQIDPKVMMRFDLDKAAERVGRINGVPEDIIRSDEEVAALSEQHDQSAQAQQLLAAAPVAAGAAKDFAQAASLAGSAPGQQAPNLGLPNG
ncbi:Head-to-tail connector protein, podovirus-type [uncultured Caudovirales phage]|uniref:Head-to-tail connector protein, podovirus-type n=1 Tax=uncultured Caudovirales phage TaxID=2100421 RepID=A0A6J5KIM1_9CAUD|nr:Head-to-tail connector protein, podovirus-type [uncultured Caudovirales phage]